MTNFPEANPSDVHLVVSDSRLTPTAQLAHDVRTPLGIIVAYAELLIAEKPGPLNPKQFRYVASIRTAADTITEQLQRMESEIEK